MIQKTLGAVFVSIITLTSTTFGLPNFDRLDEKEHFQPSKNSVVVSSKKSKRYFGRESILQKSHYKAHKHLYHGHTKHIKERSGKR